MPAIITPKKIFAIVFFMPQKISCHICYAPKNFLPYSLCPKKFLRELPLCCLAGVSEIKNVSTSYTKQPPLYVKKISNEFVSSVLPPLKNSCKLKKKCAKNFFQMPERNSSRVIFSMSSEIFSRVVPIKIFLPSVCSSRNGRVIRRAEMLPSGGKT